MALTPKQLNAINACPCLAEIKDLLVELAGEETTVTEPVEQEPANEPEDTGDGE